jgi:hypothetical protein
MGFRSSLACLAAVGVVLAYGCGGPRSSAPKPAAPVPPLLAPKGDLDPKQLPPPRTGPAATPDLSGAVYAINAATLEGMGRNGVPAAVIKDLRKLDGKTYRNAADFLAALKEAIGPNATQEHQESILRNALVVTLADPLAAPRGQSSLDEAAARSQERLLMAPPAAREPAGTHLVYFQSGAKVVRHAG